MTPSVAIFSPGRTTNRSPTCSWSIGTRRSLAVVAEQGDVLRAELEQRAERGAGAALGPGLEVPAGEDERGDDGRHLEVDLVGTGAAVDDQLERHPHRRGRPRRGRTARPSTSPRRTACRR